MIIADDYFGSNRNTVLVKYKPVLIIADDYFGSNRNPFLSLSLVCLIIADDYFGSNRNQPAAGRAYRVIIADDYFGSNRNTTQPLFRRPFIIADDYLGAKLTDDPARLIYCHYNFLQFAFRGGLLPDRQGKSKMKIGFCFRLSVVLFFENQSLKKK